MEKAIVPRCTMDVTQRWGLWSAFLLGETRGRLIGTGMTEDQADFRLVRLCREALEIAISMATEAWREDRSPCSADQLFKSYVEEVCNALDRQCGEYTSHSSPNPIL